MDNDIENILQAQVVEAAAERRCLRIRGGDTKAFLGPSVDADVMDVAEHRGVVRYEPAELTVTVRAGTRLSALEQTLAEHNQVLAFEPPHFGPGATIGGTIAAGLSGPGRPYAGAARDFVLGCRIVNGGGEVLHFGGEVMKNVAGYDVSRLMTGAFGTLGVLLEISLKVLPRPAAEQTLTQHCSPEEAIATVNRLAASPLPLSGACYDGDRLYIRLSGAETAVAAARERIGGELFEQGNRFWERVREHEHAFFAGTGPLWRLSVPPGAANLALDGKQLLDWGGAQRWLRSRADAATIRGAVARVRGHATLFRGKDSAEEIFHPLPPAIMALHRRLKHAFDPHSILNPGRMYRDL